MRISFAVCSLAVVFCLVVCVSANAEVNLVTAKAAVEDAEKTVTTVRKRAQKEFDDAQSVLQKVESSKSAAEIAASKSQAAATGNTDAVGIATRVKSLSDEVAASYLAVKQKLDTAVKSLNTLLSEAKVLEGQPDITIEPNPDSTEDYSVTNGKAAALKADAAELDERISAALELITGVESTADIMAQKAKEAQLKDSHVCVVVAVATIETMLENADTTIGQIEGKERDATGIVDEMKTIQTKSPTVSNDNIKALHTNADNALTAATGAVENAKSAKAAIQIQKDLANEALTKVKAENEDVSKAQKEVTTAEACVTAAVKIVLQLNDALQIATNSVTSANTSKENLKTALSTATSATNTERSVTNPKVKTLQDSVRADVNRIQTMMGGADGTLQGTTNNKEAVHNIVQEMKTLSTTEFIEANENIKVLYKKADDALADATGAVENAEKAKTDMTQEKQKADAALSRVSSATDVVTAQKEVDTTNECVNQVNQFAAILNNALQTAKDSVKNANDAKQKLQTALSTTTSKPGTEQSSTHSQVKPLQDSVSADVKAIQTIVGEADRILQETENHKKTVHDIVQEMKTLKTTAKVESNDINELCRTAEGEFTKMTSSVNNVKNYIRAIKQQQELADTALTEVNAETDIDKAQLQANTATSCLGTVKQIIAQLRSELHTAKSTVTNVNKLRQKLKNALSTTTTAPITEEVKETERSDIPVQGGTYPEHKDTTIPPAITNTEQSASKKSLNQGDYIADKQKDALIKTAQNVSTTALTGEKAPAPGAKNDSAMTVSVPLLVALIASAVLQ